MKNHQFYPESLFDTPELYGSSVSPDRKWVAWSWAHVGGTAQVWLAPSDGSGAPMQLTDKSEDVYISSWAPDSKSLILKHDHNGNERMHLFEVPIDDPLREVPLTELRPAYYLRGGAIDPSRSFLVYGANYDFAHAMGIESTFVYRHDLFTGKRSVLARPEKPSYCNPRLNSGGTHILYSRSDRHAAGDQLWLVDIEGREDREIVNAGDEQKVFGSWFPDGERIAFVAEADGYRRVGVWHLSDARTEWLLDDPSRNIEDAYVPYGANEMVVIEVRDAVEHISLVDLASKKEMKLELPRFSRPLAVISSGSYLVRHFNSKQPDDIALARPDGEPKSITGFWDRVPYSKNNLAEAQDFRWKSTDGLEIQGWLYRTHERARGTVLVVHGGPTGHSEDRFDLEIQYLVASGFNVLDPNYRGSTGFGLPFEESIKKEGWGGLEQEDILSGARALLSRAIAEPGKIGITGTSYGGYSSWCAITRAPRELIAAAAPICGMTDLIVDYNSTRPDLRGYSEEMLGGTPEEIPEKYKERSPIHSVKNIKGKLLIVQGEMDPNVTPENVAVVEEELRRHDIPYELLMFPNEGHGIYRKANIRTLLERFVRFFGDAFMGAA